MADPDGSGLITAEEFSRLPCWAIGELPDGTSALDVPPSINAFERQSRAESRRRGLISQRSQSVVAAQQQVYASHAETAETETFTVIPSNRGEEPALPVRPQLMSPSYVSERRTAADTGESES